MRKAPASLKDSAKSVQKGIFAASNIGTSIAMVLLVVLVLLTVADVVMRRFFNAPIGGTFEITQVLLGIIVFFSFSYCAIKGGHIVLDVLVTRFPHRVQSSIGIIIHFLSVAIMFIISWRLFAHAAKVESVGQVSAIWHMPLYPFVLLVALGSTLATLIFLIQLIHAIHEAIRKWN